MGPPPVAFSWSSHSILNDFEELSVPAPVPGELSRIHYIRVEADQESRTHIYNRYALTGSVTGCP